MRNLLSILVLGAALPVCGGLELKPAGDNLRVLLDGKLLTEYRADTRVPCLYPLVGPSGANLTRNFPFRKDVAGEARDHPHHTSFWFTHGLVNGKDFWHKPDCRIVHRRTSAIGAAASGETAFFTVQLDWVAGDRTILHEERAYTISATGNERVIDLRSDLRPADGDVLFGDTKEGSFAIRLAPTLRVKGKVAKGHLLDSEGRADAAVWGKRAKWVAAHGPDSNGKPVVVALLDHPGNLRHPTWWHARDYGLLAANPFGRHDFEHKKNNPHLGDFTLKKGDSLTLRYRLLILPGPVDPARIEKSWMEFGE